MKKLSESARCSFAESLICSMISDNNSALSIGLGANPRSFYDFQFLRCNLNKGSFDTHFNDKILTTKSLARINIGAILPDFKATMNHLIK